MLANPCCLGLDRLFVCYVKKQWNKSFTKVSLQTICVRLIPHAAIYSEFAAEQYFDTGISDPGRNTGNDDLFHVVGWGPWLDRLSMVRRIAINPSFRRGLQ